jgi:hypothetical protein
VFFDPGMDTAAVLRCMAPEGIGHASDAGCVFGMAQVGHGCFKAGPRGFLPQSFQVPFADQPLAWPMPVASPPHAIIVAGGRLSSQADHARSTCDRGVAAGCRPISRSREQPEVTSPSANSGQTRASVGSLRMVPDRPALAFTAIGILSGGLGFDHVDLTEEGAELLGGELLEGGVAGGLGSSVGLDQLGELLFHVVVLWTVGV